MLSSSYFLRLLALVAISSQVALCASVGDTTSLSQTSPGDVPEFGVSAPFCHGGRCAVYINIRPVCCYTQPADSDECTADEDCADYTDCTEETTTICNEIVFPPTSDDNDDTTNDDDD